MTSLTALLTVFVSQNIVRRHAQASRPKDNIVSTSHSSAISELFLFSSTQKSILEPLPVSFKQLMDDLELTHSPYFFGILTETECADLSKSEIMQFLQMSIQFQMLARVHKNIGSLVGIPSSTNMSHTHAPH